MDEITTKSMTVLEETPSRALKLLSAIAAVPAIRAAMGQRGYGEDDQDEGFALTLAASGYKKKPGVPMETDARVRAALAEVDAWDETNYRIAKAALGRKHKEQCDYVFSGLEASTGAMALAGVSLFLDRLDALESGAERKAMRKADKAALETLAARGITPQERGRLRELVKIATSAPALDPSVAKTQADSEAERVQALRDLRSWYDEWSEVGRAVVKRRDYQIRMGLARRKKGEKPTTPVVNP